MEPLAAPSADVGDPTVVEALVIVVVVVAPAAAVGVSAFTAPGSCIGGTIAAVADDDDVVFGATADVTSVDTTCGCAVGSVLAGVLNGTTDSLVPALVTMLAARLRMLLLSLRKSHMGCAGWSPPVKCWSASAAPRSLSAPLLPPLLLPPLLLPLLMLLLLLLLSLLLPMPTTASSYTADVTSAPPSRIPPRLLPLLLPPPGVTTSRVLPSPRCRPLAPSRYRLRLLR